MINSNKIEKKKLNKVKKGSKLKKCIVFRSKQQNEDTDICTILENVVLKKYLNT